WIGVVAAKLHDSDGALQWAKRFLQPGVTLFDDTCFGEIVSAADDFKKTSEVAAHGALICNVNQMLLDPDDNSLIAVFPAVPEEWMQRGVAVSSLATKGGFLVSGEFKPRQVRVTLENRSNRTQTRNLRVRMPGGTTSLRLPEKGVQVQGGWAVISAIQVPAKRQVTFTFEP
ncbi:MAG: hypothetical protein NT154_15455, partial [Verrucomicrobia bacterium]|nr:hypothetical protein [Verrucomicrobiota bacterium]